jgi:YbgC/YbaW family acyl-CoA thioester hydrolase
MVSEVFGSQPRYDGVLCLMIGSAAALIIVAGYVAPVPLLLALSPLIALIGALQAVIGLFRRKPVASTQVVEVIEEAEHRPIMLVPTTVKPAGSNATPAHGFDGQWFVMRMTPTYDDTNSVGNVYFANYVRWVGKARELFFNLCMPGFDLQTTDYYVLTRSFTHDFRREAKEFEAVTVRIRISQHNRKFVTLEHDIRSDTQGILGRGEQSLMFVDTKTYRPLDIPGSIIRGFLPYWPKTSLYGSGDDQEPQSGFAGEMRLQAPEASNA